MKPFLLYHWSPTERRKRIDHSGLVPGSKSVDGAWKPPYVCFSESPSLAWALSVRNHPSILSWDLWMVWSNVPSGYEVLYNDTDRTPKEYRVYERLFKRDLWMVGTRGGVGPKPVAVYPPCPNCHADVEYCPTCRASLE